MIDVLKGKKVLMLFAHCDDEVICGFPLLQQKDIEKHVFICSNDSNNPEREWCKYRGAVFAELMDDLGLPFVCLNYNSGFYRLETRQETLSRALQDILDRVNMLDYDVVFTHNPMGEYGHIDHLLIHQLAMTLGKPVLVTDIFMPSNWIPYQGFGTGFSRVFHLSASCSYKIKNDLDFYKRCEDVYRKHNVWTWCKPPVPYCKVYML